MLFFSPNSALIAAVCSWLSLEAMTHGQHLDVKSMKYIDSYSVKVESPDPSRAPGVQYYGVKH